MADSSTYSVAVIPAPSGINQVSVWGINNSGQVTGGGQNGTTEVAILGSPSGSTTIPLAPGSTYAAGDAVNASGQVAGSDSIGPFIGTVSGSSDLPVPSGFISYGLGLNAAGQVVGYGNYGLGSASQGFIGTPSGVSFFAYPPGTNEIFVWGVNNSGEVTGWANQIAGPSQAFIGTSASSSLIPLPAGWQASQGFAVNDSGQVAGCQCGLPGVGQAFIGTTSGSMAIPLPSGATNAQVFLGSLNNSGQVVGNSDAGGWIWDPVNGTQLLSSLVPAGWNVDTASSISNNGLILATASFNGGTDMYVELTPVSPPSGCSFSLAQPAAFASANVYGSTVEVLTTAGCSWTASSNSSWLTITAGSSGTGSGIVNFQMGTNQGTSPRTGVLTIGGLTFPVAQDAATAVSTLEPTGVSPGAGSGTTETFTFTFTDQAGFADLSVVDVLISTFLDGQNACYFAVAPTSASGGYLYLVDDAGDGGYVSGTPMLLPSNNSLRNSQCTISGIGSSISAIGDTLTVTLAITFSSGFAGNKAIYTAARSNTQNSGWQVLGTWSIPSPAASGPAVGGMFPARSTTGFTYGSAGTYTFTFTDSNGYGDLSVLDILVNSFLDGISACYIAYVPTSATTGYLYLVDNAGDGGYVSGSPQLLAQQGYLVNNQCNINALGSSASASGNTLTLHLALDFSYIGNQVFYVAARNNSGGNSGWQAVGSVTVP